MSTVPDSVLVERVVEITGASITEATYLLICCNNNAESAVLLFFEKGGAEDIGNGNSNGNDAEVIPIVDAQNDIDSDGVRAPIAPRREQLITTPQDDNFGSGTSSGGPRFVRPSQRVKICPLRDFAREGALMEEQLQAAYNGSSDSGTTTDYATSRATRRARATFVATSVEALESAPPGSSRLGDLYRPPTDIAYSGTFQAARNRATAVKHWLLVNVQNDTFDAQLLNRDVWANKEARKLVRKRFILWQIDSESLEGRRFIAFYHCAKLPYVCIIDPRTGEEVWKSAEPKESLFDDLKKFVAEHNDFGDECEDDSPSTSKRAAIVCDDSTENEKMQDSIEKRPRVMELSEEEQIALAIRNSIRENGGKRNANDDDDDDANSEYGSEEFVDDNTKNVCESAGPYEEQLGVAASDFTMLKLRFLNAEGTDETVQLRWPSDTLLKVLRLYITQKHPHIVQRDYKLICAFPRKTLETTDNECTLKELGLHPSANVHVSQED